MEQNSIISTTILPIALFIIMMGIGMSSAVRNFKMIFAYPKAFIVGLVNQNLLLPIISGLILAHLPLSYPIQLGLFLIVLCPSGTASNIITKMIKGNLELSVLLTTISNFSALILIPIYLYGFHLYLDTPSKTIAVPFSSLLPSIFFTTIIPIILGLGLNHFYTKQINHFRTLLKWLIPGLLFSVFLMIFLFDQKGVQGDTFLQISYYTILLNLGLLVFAALAATTFKLNLSSQLAVIVEGGLKNSAVGLYIAASLWKSQEASTVLIAYGVVSFYVTLFFSWTWGKAKKH